MVGRPFASVRSLGGSCLRRATEQESAQTNTASQPAEAAQASATDASSPSSGSLERDLNRLARQTAGTFAPRSSTATKNPAVKGSTLYYIFEVQAWLALVVGGLLSFNLIYPTDEPSIPRLMGMWAIWMFTVPSLRAKECSAAEKDALNLLFVGIPLMNIMIPFVSKSFPLIFIANTAAVVGMYAWKGVWREIYGIPLGGMPKAYPPSGSSSSS